MWAIRKRQNHYRMLIGLMIGLAPLVLPVSTHALTPDPTPPPSPGSYGLQATKTEPPPTTTATLTTPANGAAYTSSPITVSGLCTTGLLVQIYDNQVMVGAVDCTSGSFQVQIGLFSGANDLSATQFDDLSQASPDSGHIAVTYNNANFAPFGTLITLTSNYGRRAADPGTTLTWPLLLSGGTGPYAFSINWGDGTPAQLKSEPLAGQINISHAYSQSGIYHVTVTVTDANGVSAFLQLVAVSNGKPGATTTNTGTGGANTIVATRVVWTPAVIGVILLPLAYWLGRRSELVSLHKKLEKDMENYKEL